MNSKNIALSIGFVLVAGSTTVAFAFPRNTRWHQPATGAISIARGVTRGGGGGIYGTGGQSDHGIRCSDCHINEPDDHNLDARISSSFGDVGGEFGYAPGQRYSIRIDMINEVHNMPPLDMAGGNGLAVTIEDAGGNVVGTFIAEDGSRSDNCPSNPAARDANISTFVYGDCHAVLGMDHTPRTRWTFDWIAPSAGSGDLNIFIGMVDGDTSDGASLDDAVVQKVIPLLEQ